MEESRAGNSEEKALSEKFVLQFLASSGFKVVLEFPSLETLKENQQKIEAAGLTCERLEQFRPKFDHADLFMDMRSPVCAAQFDLEDWI